MITIKSIRATKRLELLIDQIEEYESRLKKETVEQEIKYLEQMIGFHNEAIVAIIRNLM